MRSFCRITKWYPIPLQPRLRCHDAAWGMIKASCLAKGVEKKSPDLFAGGMTTVRFILLALLAEFAGIKLHFAMNRLFFWGIISYGKWCLQRCVDTAL